MVVIDGEVFFLLKGGCITSGVTFDFEELGFSEVLVIFLFLSVVIMDQDMLVC